MAPLRFHTLLATTLLAAGASVFGAGPVGAAPTPAPSTSPSPSPSTSPSPTPSPTPWPTHPTDYPPQPSPSSPGPTVTSPPPVGPTGPDDLRITAATAGSVTLVWSPATPGSHPIDRYEIVYHQAFYDDQEWLQSVPPDATTVTLINGIRPTGQYAVRITAFDTYGLRSATGLVSMVIPASDTAADQTPPTAPTDLTVANSGPGGAVLTWTPSTDDVAVTGYVVSRFDRVKVVSTLVATVPGHTATVPGTTGVEEYYVRARDAAGNLSASSNLVSAPVVTPTTPPAPTCSVTYTTSAQWGGGFVADLKIANSTAATVNGWFLTFEFGGDQTIGSSWGGTAYQAGANVSIIPASWNLVIPAGGSVTVGMLGRWTTNTAPPTSAQLNGFPCTLS